MSIASGFQTDTGCSTLRTTEPLCLNLYLKTCATESTLGKGRCRYGESGRLVHSAPAASDVIWRLISILIQATISICQRPLAQTRTNNGKAVRICLRIPAKPFFLPKEADLNA